MKKDKIPKKISEIDTLDKFEFKEWLDGKATEFLSGIEIKRGNKVLDFGCGEGNYSLPAAGLVGKKGLIISMDKNPEKLDKLKKKTFRKGIKNVEAILGSEETEIPLGRESMDWVLVINVIHEVDDKRNLLAELNRIMKKKGKICVYPMKIENREIIEIAKYEGLKLTNKLLNDRILIFEKGDNLND